MEEPYRTEYSLTLHDFERISRLLQDQYGVVIPLSKRTQLSVRLHKRLHALEMTSMSDYVERLLDPVDGVDELAHFVDTVTTPRTDFFYEQHQFEYLVQHVIPDLIRTSGVGVQRPLMLWNAGCASGEEPYTLSMVLNEFAVHYPGIGFKYRILATDPSSRELDKAKAAIYEADRVASIPLPIKKQYMLKSRDRAKRIVRIANDVRQSVSFRRLNILDQGFTLREKMDVLFCRHVLKYIDQWKRQQVLQKLCQHVTPGGYIFLDTNDHVETTGLPITLAGSAVYRLSA